MLDRLCTSQRVKCWVGSEIVKNEWVGSEIVKSNKVGEEGAGGGGGS